MHSRLLWMISKPRLASCRSLLDTCTCCFIQVSDHVA